MITSFQTVVELVWGSVAALVSTYLCFQYFLGKLFPVYISVSSLLWLQRTLFAFKPKLWSSWCLSPTLNKTLWEQPPERTSSVFGNPIDTLCPAAHVVIKPCYPLPWEGAGPTSTSPIPILGRPSEEEVADDSCLLSNILCLRYSSLGFFMFIVLQLCLRRDNF